MYNGVAAHLEKNSSIYNENEEFINHKSSFKSIAAEIGSRKMSAIRQQQVKQKIRSLTGRLYQVLHLELQERYMHTLRKTK